MENVPPPPSDSNSSKLSTKDSKVYSVPNEALKEKAAPSAAALAGKSRSKIEGSISINC